MAQMPKAALLPPLPSSIATAAASVNSKVSIFSRGSYKMDELQTSLSFHHLLNVQALEQTHLHSSERCIEVYVSHA